MKNTILAISLLSVCAPLRAQLLVLDPGHGGHDLGAVVRGRYEKRLTLEIAQKLKEKLEKEGASVALTRDHDVYLPLDERVNLGERGAAFISLHLNDVRSRRERGITVYAFGRDRRRIPRRRHRYAIPPLPAPPMQQRRQSARLAAAFVGTLRSRGFRVDPPARAGFYVLKNPDVPSVLIELGYLSNPREAARLESPAYQDRLADALAASLRRYFGPFAGSTLQAKASALSAGRLR